MANQMALSFSLAFVADGASTTLSFETKRGPIQPNNILSPSFEAVPVGIIDISGSEALGTITLKELTADGEVTLTFSKVPAAGEYSITFTLLYGP
jgi:hypothetical protein